jgi:cation transporter-like permease
VYFANTALAIVAFLAVTSGFAGIDFSSHAGALQRLGALLVYVPVAVAAVTMLRIKKHPDASHAELPSR